jgi:hypothetical protein
MAQTSDAMVLDNSGEEPSSSHPISIIQKIIITAGNALSDVQSLGAELNIDATNTFFNTAKSSSTTVAVRMIS